MEKENSSGIGFAGILFLVFLVLKLTHVIDWSWWWVTSPLWIPVVLAIFLAVLWIWMKRREAKKSAERLRQRIKEINSATKVTKGQEKWE